jgi:hypothetical protein
MHLGILKQGIKRWDRQRDHLLILQSQVRRELMKKMMKVLRNLTKRDHLFPFQE